MPHVIVEFSRSLESGFDTVQLLRACHNSLLASGQFKEKDIKVRLYPCDHALVAGKCANFLHVIVYMLSGRAKNTKKELAEQLLATLGEFRLPAASCSVDVRDLDREIYCKMTG